ncbi:MAG: hypothetical protein ABI647_02115 [Gemmatimonadota bacterium]
MPGRAVWLSTLLLAWAAPAAAQLISIRTVPISQDHQFDLFPSLRMAMGGASIALGDSLLDPFMNPAKGARLRAARFFGSPGIYGVSSHAGAGRTLPLGALVKSGDWFGGMAVAAQQVDMSQTTPFFPPGPFLLCAACAGQRIDVGPNPRSHGNAYAFAMAGREFRDAGLSIGGSVSWAGLHAIDGVDLLYPASARINQHGHALDLRLGATKQWAGNRSLSALVLHNRFGTTHDVLYLDQFWDPGSQQFGQRPRSVENLDQTNTWGLHLEYQQPLRAPGWRMGWIATTNLMSHPKIPNYEIQNIPRDPGNSEAFNFGVGISKIDQASTFGIDLVYEPIWSYTWADAATPVDRTAGGTIAVGGKTIENRFRFHNAMLRMGFGQDVELSQPTKALGLQVGLMVHTINYSLAQRDNVQGTSRSLDEGWVEWTPTWGLSLRFPAWELRYRGSVTNGTGRPGVSSGDVSVASPQASGNILVAPSGPLTLAPVRVMTHQVSVSFPIR